MTRLQDKRRRHYSLDRGLGFAVLLVGAVVAYWWYQQLPLISDVATGTVINNLPAANRATSSTPGVAATSSRLSASSSLLAPVGMRTYLEVVDSCTSDFIGECVVARSGPGTEYPVVARLREHMVLEVGDSQVVDGRTWHRVIFDETLRYPERVTSDWYVAGDYVTLFFDEGPRTLWEHGASSTDKRIEVSCAEQRLRAYEGDALMLDIAISTGLPLTPTPKGTFAIYQKLPSRYMQGPLPGLASDQVYDMPGVPWNLYFTDGGAVVHGTYWHTSFGSRYSHGCVNVPPDAARDLYEWAELGTPVEVR